MLELLVDTAHLWPEAEKTTDLAVYASRALALLTPAERASCLRFMFPRDARLAIASALLKRLAVSALLRVSWADAGPASRDRAIRGGKPFFAVPNHDGLNVEFNVSHQDGIVALAAICYPSSDKTPAPEIGVDVVSTRERRAYDLAAIARDGWPRFVEMHADLLSPGEVRRLEQWPDRDDIDEQRRALLALWCLREAFVKMSGAALVAPWLRHLEFRSFRAPADMSAETSSDMSSTDLAEEVTEAELDMTLHGTPVAIHGPSGTRVRLKALPAGFMVCVAARGVPTDVEIGRWRWTTMERVMEFAERGGAVDF